MRNQRRRNETAFTLVELLVVIGIIALLISILLPSLNRARQQARLVQCMSNLRQIGQMCYIYAGQNQGLLPYGFWNGEYYAKSQFRGWSVTGGTTDAANREGHWDMLLMNALSSRFATGWNGSAASSGAAGDTSRVKQIFICPDAPANDVVDAVSGCVDYQCHPRLMPRIYDSSDGSPFPNNIFYTPYPIAKIKYPSQIAMIWDGTMLFSPALPGKMIWVSTGPQVPVAINIDNNGLQSAPYLISNYSGTTKSPSDSIDMTNPRGGPPNVDFTAATTSQAIGSIRFRHLNDKAANALMADGHVETFTYNNATHATTMHRGNIYVNQYP